MTLEICIPDFTPAAWWTLGGIAYGVLAIFVGRWVYYNARKHNGIEDAIGLTVCSILLLPIAFLIFLVTLGNNPKGDK